MASAISGKLGRLFATDSTKETQGVTIQYGEIWIRIARMGESNKRFVKLLEEQTRPYRAMIANDVELPEETSKEIMRKVYSEAILLGWGDFDDDGKPRDLEYSPALGVAEFTAQPDFFAFVRQQASKLENFRQVQAAADVKN